MSLSRRSCENLPPFFLRPRFAKTLNHNQLVLGMLHGRGQSVCEYSAALLLTSFH